MKAASVMRASVVVVTVTALSACGGGPAPTPRSTVTVTATQPRTPQSPPPDQHAGGSTPRKTQPAPSEPGRDRPAERRVTGVVVAGYAFIRLDHGEVTSFGQTETVPVGTKGCEGWRGAVPADRPFTRGLVEGARIVLRDPADGREVGAARLGAGRVVNVDPRTENGSTPQWQCEFGFAGTVSGDAPRSLRLQVDGARTMNAVRAPGAGARYVASVSTNADPRQVDACGRDVGAPHLWETSTVGEPWLVGMGFICDAGQAVSVVRRVCRPARIGSDRVVAVVDAMNGRVIEDARGKHLPAGHAFGEVYGTIVEVSTGVPCR